MLQTMSDETKQPDQPEPDQPKAPVYRKPEPEQPTTNGIYWGDYPTRELANLMRRYKRQRRKSYIRE